RYTSQACFEPLPSSAPSEDVGKMIGNDRHEIKDQLYVEARALFLCTRNTEDFECVEQPLISSKQAAQTMSRRILREDMGGNEISHNDNNLSKFVNEDVWRNILQLPLLGVVKMELYKDRVMCESL
ncbi:4704_t:CDS:2, partial [Paraglomus brasilianum]